MTILNYSYIHDIQIKYIFTNPGDESMRYIYRLVVETHYNIYMRALFTSIFIYIYIDTSKTYNTPLFEQLCSAKKHGIADSVILM